MEAFSNAWMRGDMISDRERQKKRVDVNSNDERVGSGKDTVVYGEQQKRSMHETMARLLVHRRMTEAIIG